MTRAGDKHSRGQPAGRGRRRGQSMVELALMMPLLALIMVGTLDMGRMFFYYTRLLRTETSPSQIFALEEREPATDLPEASGEAIAKEFERYLRRRDEPPGR